MSDEKQRPLNLPIVEPSAARGGEGTRAVHLPRPAPPAQQPLGLPAYRTSAFVFDTAQAYSDVLGDRSAGYSYSRVDNPTADAFALAVAELEAYGLDAPVAAQPFASGMAAISSVLLTLCRAGSHVVAPAAVYGGAVGGVGHVGAPLRGAAPLLPRTHGPGGPAALRRGAPPRWAG